MQTSSVIAIGCSDLHISHRCPIARSVEEDWYRIQRKYLYQLTSLQTMCNGCPILIAGDLTDRWNLPPETINFMLKNLPDQIFAICGQHDLPNHSYQNIKRSAYWTLVEAGKITNLTPSAEEWFAEAGGKDWYVHGFPWEFNLEAMGEIGTKTAHVALVHSYIWMKGYHFPGAPEEKRVKKYLPQLEGFNAAFFGDNHIGFSRGISGKSPFIMNCGTFMRRKIDEAHYYPQVGLLMSDGSIVPHRLDVSQDKFIDVGEAEKLVERTLDAVDFLQQLTGMGKSIVDFVEAVEQFCTKNGVAKQVKNALTDILENSR